MTRPTVLDTTVLIAGGGPIGLLAARALSQQGVACVLVERNATTTKWPKMEMINARSMELFRPNRLAFGDWVRNEGVPPEYGFEVLFSSGFGEQGEVVEKWDLPSVDEMRASIKEKNDGSMPREPWLRIMQSRVEAGLKEQIESDTNVTGLWSVKFESLVETDDGVESICTYVDTGERLVVRSQYVIGCDGAASKVRQSIGAEISGGPLPLAFYLVHFRSTDLTTLHQQGRFWHVLFLSGAALIAQDEKDQWTLHTAVPPDIDASKLDPYNTVAKSLGGLTGQAVDIKIDEILVKNSWRPSIYVTDKYTSAKKRVFLAGDSAHQLIPTGGYGMNTGVADALDIVWKIAAVLKGYGGSSLLDSYEVERKPVAERNNERSGVHMTVHTSIWERAAISGKILDSGPEGQALKSQISEHYTTNDKENTSFGIELGYRYNGSPVVYLDEDPDDEPHWLNEEYVPSTWPGARAPHVFLKDGLTSIFDLFGAQGEYTLVDFTRDASYANRFESEATRNKIPFKIVHLPDEDHVRKVWERDAVLVRPDDHVCWRAAADGNAGQVDVEDVLLTVVGQRRRVGGTAAMHDPAVGLQNGFTGTTGQVDFQDVQQKAPWQE